MHSHEQTIADGTTRNIPTVAALRQLGLSDAELSALARQGYIQRDPRGVGTHSYWRLRFRYQGRLRTVYLGAMSEFVAEVQRDLAVWQATHRQSRQITRDVHNGKRVLRKAKAQLAPILAEIGYHYHGDTLRRFRKPKVDNRVNPAAPGQSPRVKEDAYHDRVSE